MNLDETLQAVHDELASEVAQAGRRPAFRDIRARHTRRRRARVAGGGAVLAAAAVVGVVVALPGGGAHPATVQPLTSATPPAPPTAPARTPSAVPTIPTSGAPSAPPSGDPYVVVPQGVDLVWTDTRTRATGHFATDPGEGAATNHPEVSADGRRIVWATQGSDGASIETFDVATQSHVVVRSTDTALQTPAISPDGSQIAWYDAARGGVVTAASGTNRDVTYPLVLSEVQQFSYDGSGALVYLPATETSCVVQRRDPGGSTSCLLTLPILTAALGQGWSVAEVRGSGGTGSLALGLIGPDQQTEIAVLTGGGALQPVAATLTTAAAGQVNGGLLLDGGTRLAYARQFVVDERELAPPVVQEVGVTGGSPQTVARGGDVGFGAVSGS